MKQLLWSIFGFLSLFFTFISCANDDTISTIVTYTLSASASPSDGGTILPSSDSYEKGQIISLIAMPAANFVFKNWSGGATGTDNPVKIVMNSNKTVNAIFEKKDSDGDGVMDDMDTCPNTPIGESVNTNGCSSSQTDSNNIIFEGSIRLRSQEEVNEFGSNNYEEINGALFIGDNGPSSINDLTPLSSLKSIKYSLHIEQCTDLTNLNGLNNISTAGHIYIFRNENLTDITALSNISSITSYGISIYDNDELTNLNGLNNITSLPGFLELVFNNKLENTEALSNITYIGGNVEIRANSVLTRLNGLRNVTVIEGGIIINSCPAFIDLTGFDSVQSVGSINIVSNHNLVNLDGFKNLNSVKQSLEIRDQQKILNLNGLSNLTSVGHYFRISGLGIENLSGLGSLSSIGYNLEITSNDYLVDFCELQTFLSGDGLMGDYFVQWNKFDPSKQDIIDGNCSQ